MKSSDEPAHDLYTIPSYTSWFSWQSIHEVERLSLREFFDGSSITRTPRIYKEYRDFMITSYREDPTRRLSFTDIRKSLVGDISVLHKVFTFLEKWGLINFDPSNAETPAAIDAPAEEDKEDEKWRIRVEEGAPHGVRVVAAPHSLKPLAPVPSPVIIGDGGGGRGRGGDAVDCILKVSPMASYSDVYGELVGQQKKGSVVCMSCKEQCVSGHYEYSKDASSNVCEKCFKSGNYDKNKLADEFKLMDGANPKANWTEAETLLLLESVLKHGDDWDLVTQNVKTKSKLDCISKLIQLPFGDLMLGSIHKKLNFLDKNGEVSGVDQAKPPISESGETPRNQSHEQNLEHQQNGDAESKTPPLKKIRRAPISEASSSLMKQVARISGAVGSHITASAAEAAVTALCYENQCSTDIFDEDDDGLGSNATKRASQVESAEGEEKPARSETEVEVSQRNTIPLTLRMRAATATAIGAAAAHAKLLANQEEREIEYLVSTLVEAQVKKLKRKMKHVEALNRMMEKQHGQMKDLEECLITERMDILQKIFSAGISRWRDHALV
ncbi:SWI/SNF complex subunit SWI3A isoform X1 [Solanum dulcamara]|uniref:SWI/SNF complex subunit SWI3A isoform X1 n=1 Tax=Solanum dulcamara TaxID=45834 RepID=UPI0024860960|nr:SWI/SNF complex subunit SWI3A isoform X1 [Solanum dulcamara]XP_055825196.1 SWI/SNF complex subunit SWI3A isoform X1 [Solanum dulcamara]XP_055825197.1 SWI/SNF complex subunit SWI3A isoform X1 [Solanum dulcamara]XP_055825198.1 SWI/SNF complex subunit SWI3A isoform X1 [Solanum dulcamara]